MKLTWQYGQARSLGAFAAAAAAAAELSRCCWADGLAEAEEMAEAGLAAVEASAMDMDVSCVVLSEGLEVTRYARSRLVRRHLHKSV